MTLVWFGGVRYSTLVTLLAFVVIALARRRPIALLAMLAWLVGFESGWQWTYLTLLKLNPHMWVWVPDGWRWAPIALAVLGPALVVLVRVAGLRADRRWVIATVALYAVWVLTGLHANYPDRPFDVLTEIINVAVKTAWALAYLVPLATGGLRAAAPTGAAAGSG